MVEYKPFFLLDNSNKNGHVEPIMDYVLSWCLRCTNYQYVKDFQPILHKYCMYMLCKLIGKLQDINNIEIDDVTVWRQERQIDLWVEIELHVEDRKEKHAILIENKYFTLLRENQLEDYKPIFDNYYGNKSEYQKHYVLITCLYENNSKYNILKKAAENNGFDIYHLLSLTDGSLGYKESESDIYNEIFLRDWL